MTKSTAIDCYQIYIEIEADRSLSSISQSSNLPDMCWLAPLVVKAFTLRCKMLGETGELPQPDLMNYYNHIIEYIADLLAPLPLCAMKITEEIAPKPIWFDIADAVAAHYETGAL